MRKALLATASGAALLAAGPALAADMFSVGVSGSMEQWIGAVGVDKTDNDGRKADGTALTGGSDLGAKDGVLQISDSEFNIKAELEADNGMTFSVKIEVEGNSGSGHIDESQATVSGEFGQVVLGAEDNAQTLTHHGVRSTGAVGINCGDAAKWVDGIDDCSPDGFGTAGHGHGDKNQISYFSPRISGVQFGATYIPNTSQEGSTSKLNDNDLDAFALGGNYVGEFGGGNVAFSAGYYQAAQTVPKQTELKLYDAGATTARTPKTYSDAQTYKANKIDEATFVNFGLQVGFGAFSFDIAYGDYDDGKYKPHDTDEDVMVEDNKGDAETMAAGAMYSDGPMAISLGFIGTEYGDGTDQALVELGAGYTLAPGAVWKSSLFMAEKNGTDKDNGAYTTEGTGFVTGIAISF